MSEEEFIYGEPIEEKEATYHDGYIQGIYRARNIIDSKQKEVERLKETLFAIRERLQDYDLVEDKKKVIDDIFDLLNGSDKE